MYSHAFGGPLDTLRNIAKGSGKQALDELGVPKIRQNFANSYQDIQKNLNTMAKGMSQIQKHTFSNFNQVLGQARNTIKSDISSGVSSGIYQGAAQVEEDFMTKYKPVLIGGGILAAAVVGYMVLKK